MNFLGLLGIEVPIDTGNLISLLTGGAAVSLPGLIQYLRKQAKRIAENLDKIETLEARIVELEKRCGVNSCTSSPVPKSPQPCA